MKRFLFWISWLLVMTQISAQEMMPTDSLFCFDDTGKIEYAFFLQFKENSFTGICIIKKDDDKLVGSIVNEFGIKVFDFIYWVSSDKISLLNVISFMDKWYIRKVIKADWKNLLAYPEVKKRSKKRNITITEDGSVVLENLKYQIRYTLTLLSPTK